MRASWLRRGAFVASFALFAQTASAQVYMSRPPSVAASKPRVGSTPISDSLAQRKDPEEEAKKIWNARDESWMNGWVILGVGALAGGVWAMVKSDNMRDDVFAELDELVGTRWFPDDVDQWYEENSGDVRKMEKLGIGLAFGGVALMVGGLIFVDRGIHVKKTPGGLAVLKTFQLGKKR